jgi:hypothetical protein
VKWQRSILVPRVIRTQDQVLTTQDLDLGAVLSMVQMDYAGIIGVMDHNRENARNLVPIIQENVTGHH